MKSETSKYINNKLIKFNNEIKGKKVAIIGMGVSNIPLLDYFYNLKCHISVFDNREIDNLDDIAISKMKKLEIKGYFGKDNLKYLNEFDYIFRSPSAMPYTNEFQREIRNGAILTSEIEKVIELSPSHIIGVTGSDGKTTTTSLIYEIIKNSKHKCFLGGNIGIPLFDKIKDMKPNDYVILELSSFQLAGMKISPEIAVVTNISPNHLNVHKDYKDYIDCKKNIFIHQDNDGLLITNKDNQITKDFENDARGKVIFFSHKEKLENGVIFDENDKFIKLCKNGIETNLINKKDMKLRGEHNCENVCTAIATTMGITDINNIINTIKNFSGVEHRLEFVKEINDVKWYNDSIGTSPTRTIAGLNSFDEKIVLIAGGYDKHLDYEPIAKPIINSCSKLILMGQTAEKIKNSVKKELKNESKKLEIIECKTLEEAVQRANIVAQKGEIVLFSPASASFDLFKNFEVRGNRFKELVNNL